jgi:hypothetical protein
VIFAEKEHALAVEVAKRLAHQNGAEFFNQPSVAKQLRDLIEDPDKAYFFIETAGPKKAVVLDITREAFFSQWLKEIERRPEMHQIDTMGQLALVNVDLANTTPFSGLSVVDVNGACRLVTQHVDGQRPADRKPRTGVQIFDTPFKTLYARANRFMRNCHAEPGFLGYALMVGGEGYFSYPQGEGWHTEHTATGTLCIEPAGGLHAGQTCNVDLFAVMASTKKEQPTRLGVVSTVDLNAPSNQSVKLVHEDLEESTHCYILTLKDGEKLSLPVGVYYVFRSSAACQLRGNGSTEVSEGCSFAWTGAGSLTLAGKDAVVLAVCRSRIQG